MKQNLIKSFKPTTSFLNPLLHRSDFDWCFYGIRANSNEQLLFFEKYHKEYEIGQRTSESYTLGHINGLIVRVNVTFQTYNNKKLFFYDTSGSPINYFYAVEQFIENLFPYIKKNKDEGGRYKLTDGMNIHNVLLSIDRLTQNV